MKRTAILLMAIVMALNISAMDLKEAFGALSNVPHVSLKESYAPSAIVIDGKTEVIGEFRLAMASHLDGRQIMEASNAVYDILNQVPLRFMINGADNNMVGAFLYAVPAGDDKYDFLMVTMCGYSGDITVIYTTVNEVAKTDFQNAELSMKGDSLTILPHKSSGSNAFNIRINSGY